ncbi:cytochrome P450 2B11-like [Leptonychotes weddellii]|uniref:Cytochrome P450 n=1 Tax=Leptonychotes weddellii TaxID=9713 RepID=A0A7F8PZQ3_LEPWE|nr:cytochrome P450 2B11-like [Leptonychotes weddellii]
MELSVLLLALLTGLLLLLARRHPKAYGCLPPGPHPLPFLGNLLQMDRSGLLKSFLRFQEKYGDVFTVYLGPRPVVMLCGIKAIREALVDQAETFSGRGKIAILEAVFQGYGVVFANAERWKTLRRFSLATMRDLGWGSGVWRSGFRRRLSVWWRSYGKPRDPTLFFHSMTTNIICSIVFGKRFGYRDPEFLRLLDLFYQSFTLISSFSSQVRERVQEGGHEVGI